MTKITPYEGYPVFIGDFGNEYNQVDFYLDKERKTLSKVLSLRASVLMVKWHNKERKTLSKALSLRASILMVKGHNSEAMKDYKDALKYWPENENAKKGIALLNR